MLYEIFFLGNLILVRTHLNKVLLTSFIIIQHYKHPKRVFLTKNKNLENLIMKIYKQDVK